MLWLRLALKNLTRRRVPVNQAVMNKVKLRKNWMSKMIKAFRFHLIIRMMHFMLVPFTSEHHKVSPQKSFSILVRNTSLSQVHFVMTQLLKILNLRFMMLDQMILSKRKWMAGALPWATTCTSLRLRKFFQEAPQNLPMVQPISKALFGRTQRVCNNLAEVIKSHQVHSQSPKWKKTNARLFSS